MSAVLEEGRVDSVTKTGEVTCRGSNHELSLLKERLRLVKCGADKSDAQVPVLELSWRDVICACRTPIKKSKATSNQGATETDSRDFSIHYITKDRTTKKCRHEQIQLQTKDNDGDVWISHIEEKRKEGKPQKLLIIINPIGGSKTGQQQFEKRARPVFTLAGIELIVKVTERAQHAIEIVKSFDMSTVDGVVVVGGDGMYMEVLHTEMLKAQEAAGVNINDPEAKLAKPPIRIGILPGGTGNGLCAFLNGVTDFDTAVLNIVRGEINDIGMFAIHEPGKLIQYCGLLFGYGIFSSLIEKSNDMRWMQKMRYVYLMVAKVFGRKRVYDLDVEVLRDAAQQTSGEDEAGDKEPVMSTEWVKLGVKSVTAVLSMIGNCSVEGDSDKLEFEPFSDGFLTMLISTQSGFDYCKLFYGIQRQKKDVFDHDYLEILSRIKGLRLKLVEEEGGASSSIGQASGTSDVSRILDLDGEPVRCSVPQFEIRYHPHMIQVYSTREKQ